MRNFKPGMHATRLIGLRIAVRCAVLPGQERYMARQFSILLLSQFYWPEPIGSGPPIARTASLLAKRFAGITVFTTRPHYPLGRVHSHYAEGDHDREIHEGVAIERFWTIAARGGGVLARLFSETAFFLALLWRAIIRPLPACDILVTVSPSVLTVLAGTLLALGRRRHVCIVHDIQSGLAKDLEAGGGRLVASVVRVIERVAFNSAHEVIVLSDGMAQELRAMGIVRPISVLPPLFDIDAVMPGPLPKAGQKRVLYSGNLGRKQGIEQILDAAVLLQRDRPDIRILIRGHGSRRGALHARAAQLGLRNVEFADLVPEAELSAEIAAHAVHLVPQLPEGARFAMPSKIFMIMAAARPAICTADAGTPLHSFMEESGAVLCTPPNDAVALCRRIVALIDDPSIADPIRWRGREYVEREFAPAQYGLRLEQSLLGGGAERSWTEPSLVIPNGGHVGADAEM